MTELTSFCMICKDNYINMKTRKNIKPSSLSFNSFRVWPLIYFSSTLLTNGLTHISAFHVIIFTDIDTK
jgi:hypothetical protein